ncbi:MULTISPECIES: DUF1223 domain-containing protein [Micromonospora]|nr:MULTISPECIES: DUF1223 domain-containing protein [Micromonospora]NES13773.1 DUF1223 domain-containing protein [Micromonospora sp. PPF5-17B]NES35564.1 DUF1223 domain-containing protein [Micromonospora solifontis]NES55950.1 DUF1223 domain-containing protein [Micromonospora sp. PPF5-6]
MTDTSRTGSNSAQDAAGGDYWDHLGWADPFGAEANTRRQEEHVRALRSAGLYPPQMIVNRTVEFVGSDRQPAPMATAGLPGGRT